MAEIAKKQKKTLTAFPHKGTRTKVNTHAVSSPHQVLPDSTNAPFLSFAGTSKGKAPMHFADFSYDERKEKLKEKGYPAFRADQLSRHYFERHRIDEEELTDIPQAQRKDIIRSFFPPLLTKVRELVADKGKTIKSVWKLYDGHLIETVLMRYPKRTTLCISSQAGCGMACPFCATGQGGLQRNLSTAEIVEQVRLNMVMAENGALSGGPTRISNIVFMGMGEPLSNWLRVKNTLHRLIESPPNGFGLAARNITVSTVGMVPVIKKLKEEGFQVTLAVSLHAPDDELRDPLIPLNAKFKVDEVLDAAFDYYTGTKRRVSIEYALIKNMNDHEWRAELLAKKINERGRGWAHVNPIPLNPTPESVWTASTYEAQEKFVRILSDAGIATSLRDTRGSDIDGACGQLATEVKGGSPKARQARCAVDDFMETRRVQAEK